VGRSFQRPFHFGFQRQACTLDALTHAEGEQRSGEYRDQHRLESSGSGSELLDQDLNGAIAFARFASPLALGHGPPVESRSVPLSTPMGRGARAHRECATCHTPSTGTGMATFLMR
jgi:hypothetical protein